MLAETETPGAVPSAPIPMSFLTARAGLLRELAAVAGTLVDEVKLTFGPDGLTFNAVDPQHVAMLSASLPPACFRQRHFPEPRSVGLDVKLLRKVLTRWGESEPVMDIAAPSAHGGSDSSGWVEGKGAVTLRLGPMRRSLWGVDIGALTEPRIPKLDLSTVVSMPTSLLRLMVDSIGDVSDHLVFEAEYGPAWGAALRVVDGGHDDRNGGVEFSIGPFDEVHVTMQKGTAKVRAAFPLDYFQTFVKVIRAPYVRLEFADEYPMRITFALSGGGGEAFFLIAPRIEND